MIGRGARAAGSASFCDYGGAPFRERACPVLASLAGAAGDPGRKVKVEADLGAVRYLATLWAPRTMMCRAGSSSPYRRRTADEGLSAVDADLFGRGFNSLVEAEDFGSPSWLDSSR
jgi:hypothetical protein